jgi:hypothetical protein
MSTPDQNLSYLIKRKKKVLKILSKIKRLSLSHSDNVIFYKVELVLNKKHKIDERYVLDLEEDHIINIFQKSNLFKVLDSYQNDQNDQVYEIKIDPVQFRQSEEFLLQELDLSDTLKEYSGDSIASLKFNIAKDNKRDMTIIVNNNENLSIEVDRTDTYWGLLLEIAKNKSIDYDSSHKNFINYINSGVDCAFYSKDKYKPTKILGRKNGIIKFLIPVKLK